jgi:hypothetical protein
MDFQSLRRLCGLYLQMGHGIRARVRVLCFDPVGCEYSFEEAWVVDVWVQPRARAKVESSSKQSSYQREDGQGYRAVTPVTNTCLLISSSVSDRMCQRVVEKSLLLTLSVHFIWPPNTRPSEAWMRRFLPMNCESQNVALALSILGGFDHGLNQLRVFLEEDMVSLLFIAGVALLWLSPNVVAWWCTLGAFMR